MTHQCKYTTDRYQGAAMAILVYVDGESESK